MSYSSLAGLIQFTDYFSVISELQIEVLLDEATYIQIPRLVVVLFLKEHNHIPSQPEDKTI